MITVKEIPNTGAGEESIRCYRCKQYKASFYLVRETEEDRRAHYPLCSVCLSAYLNYLDDCIVLHHYNMENPDNPISQKDRSHG